MLTTSRGQDSPDHWRECRHYEPAIMDVCMAEDDTQTVIYSKNKGICITEEEYLNQFQEVYGWTIPLQVRMWWQTDSGAGTTEREDLYMAMAESWERFSITGRDTIYTYEGKGAGGAFTITIKENGTFEYYEESLSSFIDNGTWPQEDMITLKKQIGKNRFCTNREGLEFLEESSGNFGYMKLKDKDRFRGKGPLEKYGKLVGVEVNDGM